MKKDGTRTLLLLLGCVCNFLPGSYSFSNSQDFSWASPSRTSKVAPFTVATRNALLGEQPTSTTKGRQSFSAINAVPPTLPFVIGHMVGGALGAPIVTSATRREDGWYRQIPLPSFTPPDSIFAPVWTLLYALMGVAVGRIYVLSKSSPPTRASALGLGTWAVHLMLNISWAPIFFGFQRLKLGLMVNFALWGTLVGIILPSFYVLNPTSAYLLLPYLVWLTFATALNFSICRLNPTVEGYNNAKFQAQLSRLQRQAAQYSGL